MSRRIIGAAVAAGLVALMAQGAALGGSDASTLSGPFIGTWKAKLSYSEAVTRGDGRMNGRFKLVLRENGTYTMANPLDLPSRGSLVALPNRRLRFFKDSGCEYGGHERPKGGIYTWSVRESKLTLRLVSEGACTGRTQSLTYVVWNRA